MEKQEQKGKLIVIEGIDGSGKTTQYGLLLDFLKQSGIDFIGTSFPNYDSPSGRLVKHYLDGGLGNKPDSVNAYAASSFFAVDRYCSFVSEPWGDFYRNGGLVISARYTTSNAIHQAAKLAPDARRAYLKWLEEYEYGYLKLPKPDKVFMLRISTALALENIGRRSLASDEKQDIHESDATYMSNCADAAHMAAKLYGWTVLDVEREGAMLSREEISAQIIELAKQLLF